MVPLDRRADQRVQNPSQALRYVHTMRHQREPVIRGFSVFALTSILVAVVFVLTDHRRDLVGVTAGTNGPALITTIARLGLLGFTVTLVILWPQRPSLTRSPLTFAIGSYVLYIAAGVLWSPDPSFTLHKLVVLTTVGITAFCIAQVFDLDQITDLILVILVGYLVLGAAYEISSGSVQLRSDYRFEGTTSANQNGLFAAIVALISGTRLFLSHDSRSPRRTYWLLLIGSIAVTAITMSRTAMISLAAAVLIITALQMTIRTSSARMPLGAFVSTAAIASAVALVVLRGPRRGDLSSFGERSVIWEPLWGAVQERPIHGYGHLGYWVSVPSGRVNNAHSVYLDLLLDGGLIALALVLLILGLTIAKLLTATRHGAGANTVFCLAFICFLIVHGLAESSWSRPMIGLLFLSCVVARVAVPGPSRSSYSSSPAR